MLSNRLNFIKPSPTLSLTTKANELKAKGEDVINLGAGEPDFDTPDWIKQGAQQAMQQGLTRYTAVDGLPALKKAIAQKLIKDNQLTYNGDEIIVSTGGKQVIFNAMMATINSGDEVIIPAPYWVSYPDIVNLFEGKSIFVEGDRDLKLTPKALEAAISLKTKWLILNSPSNPTGCIYTKDELKALAKVLLRHPQVWILSDDIYEYLIFDNLSFANLVMVEPELKNRALIVNGVSKSYAMTGWRIGYGAGPKHLIKAMTMLQSQSTSNACSVAQAAAIAAINGSLDFLDNWRNSFVKRRDTVLASLQNVQELECVKPNGAFYIYIKCLGVLGKKTTKGNILQSDQDFCNYLLEDYGVAAVSGNAFGMSPYFRISYPIPLEQLMDACQRIKAAVAVLL